MNSIILPYRDVTKHVLHQLMAFFDNAGSALPFHCPDVPITWWEHFNGGDGEPFAQRRGRNFLGARCWLENFQYIIAREGEEVCGAVPMASYSVRLPNEQDNLRMLTFAGDYALAPYQDFLALPQRRREVVSLLIDECVRLMRAGHELLFFGYIPEDSPNVAVLDGILEGMPASIAWKKCVTSQRGGVHPWTLASLKKLMYILAFKLDTCKPEFKPVDELKRSLASCKPDMLLFPRNRMKLKEELRSLVDRYAHVSGIRSELSSILTFLNDSTTVYPFIDLPVSRESYLQGLGKKTRFNYRHDRKRLLDSGGVIEKVTSENVSEKDIRDYLNLHMKRWGRQSIAINELTSGFHTQLCLAAAQRGYFTLFFLTLDGKRIAAHSCFDIRGRREAYFTGLDPDYEKSGAGIVLFHETILDAIDNRFTRYEFGYGGDDYKFKFTKTYAKSYSYFIAEKGRMPDLNRIFTGYECMVECAPSTGAGIVCPKDSTGLC